MRSVEPRNVEPSRLRLVDLPLARICDSEPIREVKSRVPDGFMPIERGPRVGITARVEPQQAVEIPLRITLCVNVQTGDNNGVAPIESLLTLKSVSAPVPDMTSDNFAPTHVTDAAEAAPAPSGGAASGRGLRDDIEAFADERRRLRHNSEEIGKAKRLLEELMNAQGWKTHADIERQHVMSWIGRQQEERGWKSKTHDQVVNRLRTFGATMMDLRRWPSDPFAGIAGIGGEADEGSRALSTADVFAIARAGKQAHQLDGRCAGYRWLWNLFLFYTGLRVNEAWQIRLDDIELSGDFPLIHVRREIAKNKCKWELPLHPALVTPLREMIDANRLNRDSLTDVQRQRLDSGLLFLMRPNHHTFDRDLFVAGIAKFDKRKRAATFHSLRKTFETALGVAGVGEEMCAYLRRHMTTLTKRYFDPTPEEMHRAIARLPSWDGETPGTTPPDPHGHEERRSESPAKPDATQSRNTSRDRGNIRESDTKGVDRPPKCRQDVSASKTSCTSTNQTPVPHASPPLAKSCSHLSEPMARSERAGGTSEPTEPSEKYRGGVRISPSPLYGCNPLTRDTAEILEAAAAQLAAAARLLRTLGSVAPLGAAGATPAEDRPPDSRQP